jgi:hypothetical protein
MDSYPHRAPANESCVAANLNSSPVGRTYGSAEYARTGVFPSFGQVPATAVECE